MKREIARTLGNVVSTVTLAKLLGHAGRRRRGSMLLPALGMFGAGMLVGAGAGILFAPQSGSNLRDSIARRLEGAANDLRARARRVEQEQRPARGPAPHAVTANGVAS